MIIILFGGSDILPRLTRELQSDGHTVYVYTATRQATENIQGEPLISALSRVCAIPPVVCDDINTVFPLELARDAIGLGIGEAWVFGEAIRTAFGDRLLDFMSIPLPRYRGGAHISWAIMRGERQWGACLQCITARTIPGEYDDGEIVARWDYDIPSWCRIPQQWFDVCGIEDIAGIKDYLAHPGKEIEPETTPVASLFLPRLKTTLNGVIDWNQEPDLVERFICAFDSPYPGARTLLNDEIVAIKGASWDGLYETVVPFQRGLVLRVQDGLHIAVPGGVIMARTVLKDGMDITDQVKAGMRFVTPAASLEYALTTPVYTPKASP